MKKNHGYEITLDEAIKEQIELKTLINKLNNDYGPRIFKKVEEKNRVLESARKLFDARDNIIDLFKKGTSQYKDNAFKTKQKNQKKNQKKTS